MTTPHILRCGLDDSLARPVLEGLTHEYALRYPSDDSEMGTASPREFDPPEGLFLVAVTGTTTVAGGGFRRLEPGVCEIKRMWTHPEFRRTGLARIILHHLEDAACAAGYDRLRLETGPEQPEAEAFYSSRYRRIPTYGPYPQDLAFEGDLTAICRRPDHRMALRS